MFGSTLHSTLASLKQITSKQNEQGSPADNYQIRERVKKSQPSNATSRSSGFPLETSEEDEWLREEGRSTRQPAAVG